MNTASKFFITISKMLVCLIAATAACSNGGGNGTDPGPEPEPGPSDYLAAWKQGYLDIHHIATGKGDAALVICPDGTTILIDAGDVGNGWGSSGNPPMPDDSKSPGEWISDYIRHFTSTTPVPATLDYAFMTHLHSDHIGNVKTAVSGANGYVLSGITMVGEHIPIKKFIDRGWPEYDFPSRAETVYATESFFDDYYNFVTYISEKKGTSVEKFTVGTKNQFTLQHNPSSYPTFEIRNLYANGEVWTGTGTGKRTLYGTGANADENMHSCAIKVTYGPFSYFAGGDISGYNHQQYAAQDRDIETHVGEVTGKTTVMSANHHGWVDAVNANFLRSLEPEVIVVPASHIQHPHPSTVARMVDPLVYEGDRSYFITTLSDGNKSTLGSAANYFESAGHIVVRVYESANKYEVFVLDASKTDYPILYSSGQLTAGN